MELVREEIVREVNEQGEVVLVDGTKWLVDPREVTTAFAWPSDAAVRIELVDEDTSFPFELTEIGSGIAVRAMKLEEPPGVQFGTGRLVDEE
jgi:hypothetical protein